MGAHEKDPGRAAPDVGPLRVARLCSLPIGVLAWRAPEPTLTVIVKATFTLDDDGTSALAAQQEPLTIDRPSASGSFGDLDRVSDFIPLKSRVDVLLTGHARAEAAMHTLSAGFAVDKLRRRFYATTEEPSLATPLWPEYLRSATGEATRVSARAMWAGTLDGAAIVGDDGVPCAPIPRGFDYTAFNVAPLEQQLEMLSLTATIVLDGLTPTGRRTARLPGIRPRVFVLSESGFGGARPPDEVVLRCDTLWIDADRCRCALTWRGVVALAPGARAAPALVLALDEGDRKKTWARALTELDDATWITATRPEEVAAAQGTSSRIDIEDEDEDENDGPTTDRMAHEAAHGAGAVDDEATRGHGAVDDEATRGASLMDEDSTRTHVLFQSVSLPDLIEDEPSTNRRGSAQPVPPARALLVLGGFRGALASFEGAADAADDDPTAPPDPARKPSA